MPRSFVSLRWVAQVGLDGGVCASEPAGDLADRETLFVAVVAGERHRSPPLQYTPLDGHPCDNTRRARRQSMIRYDGNRIGDDGDRSPQRWRHIRLMLARRAKAREREDQAPYADPPRRTRQGNTDGSRARNPRAKRQRAGPSAPGASVRARAERPPSLPRGEDAEVLGSSNPDPGMTAELKPRVASCRMQREGNSASVRAPRDTDRSTGPCSRP